MNGETNDRDFTRETIDDRLVRQVSHVTFGQRIFTNSKVVAKKAAESIKRWLHKPGVLPTYCFEYAPDC